MEDYAPLLWILIMAGILVFNASSKLRKAAQKAVKHLEEQGKHEAWPSWDTSSAPQPDEAPTFQQETADMRQSVPQHKSTPRPQTGNTAPASSLVMPKETPDPHDTPTEDIKGGITEDFDLRRAILYSEILKPKFDK